MHSMESHSGQESSIDDFNPFNPYIYANDERRRIDMLKQNLREGEWDPKRQEFLSQEETIHKYEQGKIIDRPNLIKRIGRKILDLLNIYSVSSEIRCRRILSQLGRNRSCLREHRSGRRWIISYR